MLPQAILNKLKELTDCPKDYQVVFTLIDLINEHYSDDICHFLLFKIEECISFCPKSYRLWYLYEYVARKRKNGHKINLRFLMKVQDNDSRNLHLYDYLWSIISNDSNIIKSEEKNSLKNLATESLEHLCKRGLKHDVYNSSAMHFYQKVLEIKNEKKNFRIEIHEKNESTLFLPPNIFYIFCLMGDNEGAANAIKTARRFTIDIEKLTIKFNGIFDGIIQITDHDPGEHPGKSCKQTMKNHNLNEESKVSVKFNGHIFVISTKIINSNIKIIENKTTWSLKFKDWQKVAFGDYEIGMNEYYGKFGAVIGSEAFYKE